MDDPSDEPPIDDLREDRLRRQVEKIRTATDELRDVVFEDLASIEEDYDRLVEAAGPGPVGTDRVERAVWRLPDTVEANTADIEDIADYIDPESDRSPGGRELESEEFTELVMLGLSEAGEILADVEHVETLLRASEPTRGDGGSGPLRAITSWLNSIKSTVINTISRTFWDIINAHRNPKSWTINGNTGFGMLGLSGTVGASVTFD